jgi:hypothetical protein
MGKLPKHHPGQTRKTVSLSFSLPLDLEGPLNVLAAEAGMSRSEYIAQLVRRELSAKGVKLWPQAPLRIRRKPQS